MQTNGTIALNQLESGPPAITRPGTCGAPGQRAGSNGGADFSRTLSSAQQNVPPPRAISHWQRLGFLTTAAAPRIVWPWTHSCMGRLVSQVNAADAAQRVPASHPLSLAEFPHPPGDNGRGVHWIPTVSQSPEIVDRYVDEAAAMGMKWVVFLNDGANVGANDYLVQRLTEAGIEPVMRVYTAGLVPVQGDLTAMVRHYVSLGVRYFQLYNEPNLKVETGGQPPDAARYLDLWVPAAQQVVAGGGLPGFGALSPQGDVDDRGFLRQALQELKARGQLPRLDRAWLAMHNYTGARPLTDPDGFLRFRQYDAIVNAELGRQLPIIGTEGGTHVSSAVTEPQQIAMVTRAYAYMGRREPYNFAYTYWIIANGDDPAWESQALFHSDRPTALALALAATATGGRA